MGFKAVAWGRDVKCNTPLTKLVLIILCEYADEKNSCFPSQGYLAEMCGVSDRQIRRSLVWLEEQNLIRVQHRSGTSNRYFVSMDSDVRTPLEVEVQTPRKSMSDNKKDNKKELYKIEKSLQFTNFWKLYPRKIGKKDALKKYQKVSQKHTALVIQNALIKQLHIWEEEKRENKYIPHASTWLNQERFLDDEIVKNEKTKMNLSKLWG